MSTKGTEMATTFPSVRDQLRTYRQFETSGGVEPETIDSRKLKILGRVGRASYAAHGERELKIKGDATDSQPRPDQVIVRHVRRVPGQPFPAEELLVGTYVEPGTFERIRNRKARLAQPKRKSRRGPVDALFELRQSVPRQPVPLRAADDSPVGIIKGALSKQPQLLVTDGRAAYWTLDDVIAELTRRGTRYGASPDGAHLLVWRDEGGVIQQRLIEAYRPLLLADAKGERLRCAYPHPGGEALNADSIAVGRAPVCNGHLFAT
jgi:hypothetical protein